MNCSKASFHYTSDAIGGISALTPKLSTGLPGRSSPWENLDTDHLSSPSCENYLSKPSPPFSVLPPPLPNMSFSTSPPRVPEPFNLYKDLIESEEEEEEEEEEEDYFNLVNQ